MQTIVLGHISCMHNSSSNNTQNHGRLFFMKVIVVGTTCQYVYWNCIFGFVVQWALAPFIPLVSVTPYFFISFFTLHFLSKHKRMHQQKLLTHPVLGLVIMIVDTLHVSVLMLHLSGTKINLFSSQRCMTTVACRHCLFHLSKARCVLCFSTVFL